MSLGGRGGSAVLTLPELAQEMERYLIQEYLVTPHRETGHPTPRPGAPTGEHLPKITHYQTG